jgi:hypothetical protein
MIPHRIAAKRFVDNFAAVDLPAMIPVFHRWIAEPPVEGLLVDVADYKHVHNGPGVILIGHESDFALNLRDGRPGVQVTRKRGWPAAGADDLRSRLLLLLRLVAQAESALTGEDLPGGRLRFLPDEIELQFSDQLRSPGAPQTFAAVRPVVAAALAEHYPEHTVTVEYVSAHPQAPLTVRGLLG